MEVFINKTDQTSGSIGINDMIFGLNLYIYFLN
jgi:hypothetical protein